MALNTFPLVFWGGDVVNNGTVNGTGNSAVYFGGAVAQTLSGSGTIGTGAAPVPLFALQNPSGLIVQSPVFTSFIALFYGNVTGANNVTLGSPVQDTSVQIGVTSATRPGGSFDVSPTWNLGAFSEELLYAQESTPRTTGFEVNPTRHLSYLGLDNVNNLTIVGGDLTVDGAFPAPYNSIDLSNGRVITGSNTFTYSDTTTGTIGRTTGYVDGNFKKAFGAAGSKLFEVGTANGYSPVTFNATAGTFPADVTIKATETSMPGIVPAATALSRYWTITATGFTADLTFNYLDPTDIPGTATEANFKLFRRDGGGFTDVTPFTLDTTLNTASVTGMTTFSDWSLAEQAAVAPSATVTGDATICEGSSTDISVALTGTGPWNLTWFDGFVQNGVAASPAVRTVSPASTSTYSISSVADAFFPSGSQSGTATVTVNPVPGAPALGSNSPLCAGSALSLTASTVSGATYAWTGPNGFSSTDQNPTIASAATGDTGTYSCTITVGGCASPAATIDVTVNQTPATPTAGSNGPVCEGATLNLTTPDVPGATFAWSGPNGFASATQNPSISSVTTAATGTYSVTVTLGSCISAAGTTDATVNASTAAPVVTAPAPITLAQSVCCGTFGGASASTSPTLATFLSAGSATDDCDATPAKLTPQVGTTDVTSTTCFETGTTAVTFRFQDAAGHTGTANAGVTVQMFGDLNLDGTVDPSDMVILRGYFNFAITPGTPPFVAPIGIADLTHEGDVDPSDMVMLRAYFNFAVTCLAP